MTRPFSDADTTFMEELHPPTVPIHVAQARLRCGYCGIKLNAVPEAARQLVPDGPHYHPSCIGPARSVMSGLRDRVEGMLRDAEGQAGPEPRTPHESGVPSA